MITMSKFDFIISSFANWFLEIKHFATKFHTIFKYENMMHA